VLYLTPDSSVVTVGQKFTLTLCLENPKDINFDKFGVTLSFDPRYLALVPIGEGEKAEAVKSATNALRQPGTTPVLLVNKALPQQGLVFYHVHLPSKESRRFRGAVGQVQFQALASTSGSSIRFVNRDPNVSLPELAGEDRPWTYLETNGEDVLGQAQIEGDGVLSASVRIGPSQTELPGNFTAMTRERKTLQTGSVRMSIVPSILSVQKGERFAVRIRLENPKKAAYDYACVLLEFDPRFVRILDADKDNWIRTGVNILDGPFHSAFPFDLARSNHVIRTRQGAFVDYRQGGHRVELTSEGYFAEVHALALKAVPLTK